MDFHSVWLGVQIRGEGLISSSGFDRGVGGGSISARGFGPGVQILGGPNTLGHRHELYKQKQEAATVGPT